MATIQSLLNNPNQPLNAIVRHSKRLEQLQKALKQTLDAKIASHCSVANYKEEAGHWVLVLSVDNASWLSKIRYQSLNLLAQLQKTPEFRDVKKIDCFVDRDHMNPKKEDPKPTEPAPKTILSEASKTVIKTTAKTIKDKALKKALSRLAE